MARQTWPRLIFYSREATRQNAFTWLRACSAHLTAVTCLPACTACQIAVTCLRSSTARQIAVRWLRACSAHLAAISITCLRACPTRQIAVMCLCTCCVHLIWNLISLWHSRYPKKYLNLLFTIFFSSKNTNIFCLILTTLTCWENCVILDTESSKRGFFDIFF